jgi:hypothetical protein
MALVVSGTGIGIGAPALRSLGQPFQQADSSIGRKLLACMAVHDHRQHARPWHHNACLQSAGADYRSHVSG